MNAEQDRIAQLERQNAILTAALAKSNGFDDPSQHGFNYSGNAPEASNNIARSQSNMGYRSDNVMMVSRSSDLVVCPYSHLHRVSTTASLRP